MRKAQIQRQTGETDIQLELNLDGQGCFQGSSGVGFLDHMLQLFARHAVMDLELAAQGDLHVDQHHTVEDVGICLGLALEKALGDKAGITRYGHVVLPMEEALCTVAVDLSGRPYVVFQVDFPTEKIGQFDSQLVEDFWYAVATHGRFNLHVLMHYGRNSHHMAEAVFKGAARALRAAVAPDLRQPGVPSTKGVL